jgi:type I restriction enzyme S subunit
MRVKASPKKQPKAKRKAKATADEFRTESNVASLVQHNKGLPDGWKWMKLGEVADYLNGRGFKKSEWEQNGLPIIRIQNLNKETSSYNYTNKVFEDRYRVKEGDLLFAWAAP